MKLKKYLIIICIWASVMYAQESKKYDMLHLDAHIQINPYQKQVTGRLIYQIKLKENTPQIVLDAPGVQILKVKTGWFKTSYKNTDKLLIINKKFKKNKTYKIRIEYVAYPKKAMYFTGWKDGGRRQVWTQGQGKNNSHWLPVNDDQNDKFTWTMHITFSQEYPVISNGVLSDLKQKDSLTTYTFKQEQPAPAYLIFVGAGKYRVNKLQTYIPVYNYAYPDIENDKTYYRSQEIFNFIEKEIGVKYPWKNYKQVPCRDFLYGGMENVSATSFNADRYVVDSIAFNDDNFVNVSAHELAHQWFGDWVTGKSSSDHWLHEGFATYYARLNDANIFGKDYNDYQIYQYDQQIIAAQHTDTVPLHRPNASSLTYYQKGAKVVSMLRQEIGDKKFKLLIKNFLHNFAFKNASIADFKNEVYRVAGDSLNGFFNLWLEQNDIPKFVIKQQNDSLIFVKNSHDLPINFQIITSDSTYSITKSNSFKLTDYQNIKTIIANPENHKLYDIQFEKDKKYLSYQLLHAPSFIDRFKVFDAIYKWPSKDRDSLYKILIKQNNYYPVYAKILADIKRNPDSLHIDFIAKLFQKDLKTRQQIAIQIRDVPPSIKNEYKNLLNDVSYFTRRMVLWHYWKSFKDEQEQILETSKNLSSDRTQYFRLMWLSLALITPNYQEMNKNAYMHEIISYASPQYNMLVRLNAFEMIDALQLITPQSIDYVIDAAFHFNWRLHQPARQLLKKWAQNPEYKKIINLQVRKLPNSDEIRLLKWLR